MNNDRTDAIRNLALIGPAGAGKTTLADALLYAAGAIKQRGRTDRGDTVCDFDPREIDMAHSLDTAICHCTWQDTEINIIDTPGFTDFLPRATAVLPAVECAALVVSAAGGLETGVRRMMKAAGDAELGRLIIVNKMDSEPDKLDELLAEIQEAFGTRCLPVNLPSEHGRKVVDCFFRESGEITDFSSVAEAHTRLLDQVVEVDEALMEAYLESGQNLDPQRVARRLRKGPAGAAPDPGDLRVRRDRRRHRGAARLHRQAAAQPARGESAAVHARRGRRRSPWWSRRSRTSTSWRTSSRSWWIPTSAARPCCASTRARSARAPSCSSAIPASPSS
jgi:small GTP-binding protein